MHWVNLVLTLTNKGPLGVNGAYSSPAQTRKANMPLQLGVECVSLWLPSDSPDQLGWSCPFELVFQNITKLAYLFNICVVLHLQNDAGNCIESKQQ